MGEFKYDGCDADSPTGVIGLIEYFGAAEVLALSTRLCVVRRGAKHLHNFVVIILKEIVNLQGMLYRVDGLDGPQEMLRN